MSDEVALDALATNTLEVKVREAAAKTLPPDDIATKRQTAVLAHREACGPDGASLGWVVELELLVGCNVACSALGIR